VARRMPILRAMPRVSKISLAPVKGFRLLHPDEVELTTAGVVENRRFVLVDGEGKRLRSSLTPWPVRVVGSYDAAAERLWMRFPDGAEVEGSALELGESVHVDFDGRTVAATVVDGPWTERLSGLAGHPVRLARPASPGDVYVYPVTLVSEASVERLGREAGRPVDGRRFRMLFTLEGCDPHAEDGWAGRVVRVGESAVRVEGPVDRCAVTTRDPESGERDLDTLRVIKAYRGLSDAGTIDFGVLATVERPGRVRVGDSVEPL
jgi:uncharacterized protein